MDCTAPLYSLGGFPGENDAADHEAAQGQAHTPGEGAEDRWSHLTVEQIMDRRPHNIHRLVSADNAQWLRNSAQRDEGS